jgi:hypothetical protein
VLMSRLFAATLRETPAGARGVGHALLERAGFTRLGGSKGPALLPLGHRAMAKIEGVIRDALLAPTPPAAVPGQARHRGGCLHHRCRLGGDGGSVRGARSPVRRNAGPVRARRLRSRRGGRALLRADRRRRQRRAAPLRRLRLSRAPRHRSLRARRGCRRGACAAPEDRDARLHHHRRARGAAIHSAAAVGARGLRPATTEEIRAAGAVFLDRTGREQPVLVGHCAIALAPMLACIAAAHHDERGLRWPVAVSPYDVHLVSLGPAGTEVFEDAARVCRLLEEDGLAALFDSREESPGVKFADADLGVLHRGERGAQALRRGEGRD